MSGDPNEETKKPERIKSSRDRTTEIPRKAKVIESADESADEAAPAGGLFDALAALAKEQSRVNATTAALEVVELLNATFAPDDVPVDIGSYSVTSPTIDSLDEELQRITSSTLEQALIGKPWRRLLSF